MKTVFGTLLLIFVILLSSIQLSAQSGHQQLPELPDTETFENIPSGHNLRLSNGYVYKSLGSGMIIVQYNSVTRDAYIREGGRVSRTNNRVLPSEEFFEHIAAGNRVNLANGHSYISQGNEPIKVRYNTVYGVAHVTQGDKKTILGELMQHPYQTRRTP